MPLLRTPQLIITAIKGRGRPGLLPFVGAALAMWTPQVDPFGEHFRLIRYDTRGHGESSVPPAPYSIADLGGDVLRLLDALEIERAHFCGLSMGGTTGKWLGAHAADRIERLVLCNTAPFFGAPEVLDARIETVRREGMAALADGILQRWFTADSSPHLTSWRDRQHSCHAGQGYAGCCAALRDLDERDHLAKIAPVFGARSIRPRPSTQHEVSRRRSPARSSQSCRRRICRILVPPRSSMPGCGSF
jgi:3-oxoadipate enol-lactonase